MPFVVDFCRKFCMLPPCWFLIVTTHCVCSDHLSLQCSCSTMKDADAIILVHAAATATENVQM